MAIETLAKLGKSIYDRGIYAKDKIWLGHNYVSPSYEIVLDRSGALREVRDLKKGGDIYRIPVPIGVYKLGSVTVKKNDIRWSDNNSQIIEYPYLIHDRMQILLSYGEGKQARQRYLQKMQIVVRQSHDWKLKAILRFVRNSLNDQTLQSIEGIRQKDFFRFVIIHGGTEYRLWEEQNIKDIMARYFFDQLSECAEGDLYCEITGWKCSYHIYNHSQVLRGTIRPRVISSKAYNRMFGGSREHYEIVQIGAETAAYYNFAINYITDKVRNTTCSEYVYLSTLDGTVYLPICYTRQEFLKVLAKQGVSQDSWKEDLHNRIAGTHLCFIVFDAQNGGRLSIQRAQIFSKKESLRMIDNIAKWMEIISYSDYKDNNMSLLGLCNLTAGCDSKDMLLAILDDVLFGNWASLRMKVFSMCAQRETWIKILLRIIREEYQDKMNTIQNDFAYLAGQMFACAELIEEKAGYYRKAKGSNQNDKSIDKDKDISRDRQTDKIHRYLLPFTKNPLMIWMLVRSEYEKYLVEDRFRYRYLTSQIEACEEVLLKQNGWNQIAGREAILLMGYDCMRAEYFRKLDAKEYDEGGMEDD